MEKINQLIKQIEIEPIVEHQELMFLQLAQCIHEILYKIGQCSAIHDADEYFSCLENLQGKISIIISQNKTTIPDVLWKFYTDFDRIDDKQWRTYLFEKIKSGNYSLQGEPALYDWFPRT